MVVTILEMVLVTSPFLMITCSDVGRKGEYVVVE